MKIRYDSPDIVYFVKESENNDELRYSLRSLKNINHRRVFIIGHKPAWVSDRIINIPTKQLGKKYDNVYQNWFLLLADERISEQFILMNDDFFIMKPTPVMPTLRRVEPIDHYIDVFTKINPVTHYVKTMRGVRDLLKSWGFEKIDSYELHTPMLFEKSKLRLLFKKVTTKYTGGHIRTLYGNYFQIGGERVHDVKVLEGIKSIPYSERFLSTSDGSFENHPVGEYIRRKFARVLMFSHANDPDGILSVILAQLAFHKVDYLLTNNPQADILEYMKHSQPLEAYEYVFICDIYPSLSVLEKIPNAYWFDHKQNSLDKIKQNNLKLPNAHVKLEFEGRPASASQLFYLWLKENKLLGSEHDAFVEHVRQLDTWDFLES